MNATEYFAWWQYSGTGLGASSPGEKYRQLRRELTQAGTNVVVISEFLEQNPDGIDIGRWRRTQVFGPEGLQTEITAEALEAIGAIEAAKAIRDGRGTRGGVQGLAPGGTSDRDEAQKTIERLRDSLQERISARFPTMVEDADDELRKPLPRTGQDADVEMPQIILELLDDYVKAHHDELVGDVAKHGDPRQTPSFDPRRFLDEQARQGERLSLFRDQRSQMPILREKLDRLKKRIATDPPDSPALQRERQKVTAERRRFARYDPEDLIADVRDWLQAVDQLAAEKPSVFRPEPTQDPQINANLTAIGEYDVEFGHNVLSLTWSRPQGLTCNWAPASLTFSPVFLSRRPDSAGLAKAYGQMIASWEGFCRQFPGLEPKLKQFVLEKVRRLYSQRYDRGALGISDGEREPITDEDFLQDVREVHISLRYSESGGVRLSIHVDTRCDEEHGIEVEFDADGKIAR